MFQTLQQLLGTAVMERFILVLNHVLTAEPVAVERLKRHAGRCIRLQLSGWPSLLPALPELAFTVTRAGLIEWCAAGAPPEPDLCVTIDASNPARMVARGIGGQRPPVDVAGDAGLAADVSWLIDNLRWDAADDIARVIGPGAAHELARIGRLLADGLRDAVGRFRTLASRARGDARPERPAR
jgi:ubiquinone biosynthesis protein UbiJ